MQIHVVIVKIIYGVSFATAGCHSIALAYRIIHEVSSHTENNSTVQKTDTTSFKHVWKENTSDVSD